MTNEKIYHLDVTDASDGGEVIANAYGNIAVVSYVARDAEKKVRELNDGAASVTLVEVQKIGGEPLRTIVTLTADAETVALVLKKRLSSERKAGSATSAGQGTTQTEPSPTVETQQPTIPGTDGVIDGVPQGHTEF